MIDIVSSLSALGGAGLGAYLGHRFAWKRHEKMDDRRSKSIAMALRTELEANKRFFPDNGLFDLGASLKDVENRIRLPSTRLYDGNVGELGRFCPKAVQSVILVYDTIHQLAEEAERVRNFINECSKDNARVIICESNLTEEEREERIQFWDLKKELMERINKAIDFLNREIDS